MLIRRFVSVQYQPRYSYLILKGDFSIRFSIFSVKNDQLSYVDKSKEKLKQRLIVEMEEYSAKLLKKKLLEICLSVCDILLKLRAT